MRPFSGAVIRCEPRLFLNRREGHINLNHHLDSVASEEPFRRELLSVDLLQQHARSLAGRHKVGLRKGLNRLLPRLASNEKILRNYNEETLQIETSRQVTPAAEWLLDNFYLIEDQIRTARRHLPRRYSRELPHLVDGPRANFPRVYDLAVELVSHVDARIDFAHLTAFVAAYQEVTPLTLGELWAIPIILRLALIENLRRVAALLSAARVDRNIADEWADRLLAVAENDPSKLIVTVARMAQTDVSLSEAFVTEFWRRAQEKAPAFKVALNWLEEQLATQGFTIEHLVQTESQRQAADQVSVGNSISSLRFLDATDWREFVESLSVVEQTLRTDPANVYGEMEFKTRDQYRHVVESVSRHSSLAEWEVAKLAVDLARRPAGEGDSRCGHVGYYLVDDGLPELERAAKMRPPIQEAVGKSLGKHPLLVYLGGIAVIALGLSAWCWLSIRDSGQPLWTLVLAVLLCLLCASQLALFFVNWLATLIVPPRSLPRLDFSEGIPAEHATLVVVPTMLTSKGAVDDLLEALEIRYLANRDPNIYFALLTDWGDSKNERMPEDDALLRQAQQGVEELNRKYHEDRPDIFFLFHRPRLWNPKDRVWMGYERKRGKLGDLNRLLRGGGPERFREIAGDLSKLPHIKYVVTLDTDTQLPRDAAHQLVGVMAHPLNRPIHDEKTGRVIKGYGILQPRVGITLPMASRSHFARFFAGDAGIDPYTRTVSDVYQDLFEEGSFIGKGIYDVDAFERAVGGKFPENRILSHDLLEGTYARSGLISDVQLFEGFPAHYVEETRRRHRWIRGDWQIASWLLPKVPGAEGRGVSNPLCALSRWKILDNLRRSVVPAALLGLLILGWIGLPQFALGFTALAVVTVFLPGLLAFFPELIAKQAELPVPQHLRGVGATLLRNLGQSFFSLAFLPYEALMNVDATLRTFGRLLFTSRNLLEWQPASGMGKSRGAGLNSVWAHMGASTAVAIVIALALISQPPAIWALALPFLVLWACAPLVAWWISAPLEAGVPALDGAQKASLRLIARATWRYFEKFITANENWLPPDNFQEHPEPVIASRTSTTNIGMGLISTLAAWDYGYLSLRQLSERIGLTLETMGRLQRYNGHFYNWYNTRTLEPLLPLYISTVDNGNLAGLLFTLREGLLEAAAKPFPTRAALPGLRDTLGCWLQAAQNLKSGEAEKGISKLRAMESKLSQPQGSLKETFNIFADLLKDFADVPEINSGAASEYNSWRQAFQQLCQEYRDEFQKAFPWLGDEAELRAEGGTALINWPETLAQFENELKRMEAPPASEKDSAKAARLTKVQEAMRAALIPAKERALVLERLAARCDEFARMDFSFLYDAARKLFVIGYNVTHHQRDGSYYDLLASEARLASFVAIALGQVPQENWFALGRLVTSVGGQPTLISWSGSLFEYLTPPLIMPSYQNTLLDVSCRAMVTRQIEYGKQRGVPWGISESCYNLTDAQSNYQYRAFGVPGLGFKRGLADDLVVAPYATLMSFINAPLEAWANIKRLRAEGAEGVYGFYEALDYTPSRLPRGKNHAVVRCYMAHHQGMALLGLTHCLLDRPMQRRFEANPLFRAAELLLQERVPKETAVLYPHKLESARVRPEAAEGEAAYRVFTDPNTNPPEVHLLSNGRYHVMVTSAGGGYSFWNDTALTRWREDPTRDCWGAFIYLRDCDKGRVWSAAHQPTLPTATKYEAIFSQGRAEFRMRFDEIDSHVEIAVSPEDDVEVRRVTITNYSDEVRTIDVTSYAEVVLNSLAADQAHPAFSKLFIQTQILRGKNAIVCSRRPRAKGDQPPLMFHLMLLQSHETGDASFETDRGQFLGRGRDASAPAAMQAPSLSNSEGPVLDPAVAIRRAVRLAPQESTRLTLVTGSAPARDALMTLVEKYQDKSIADRVFELAWTHGLVTLRHLNTTEPEAQLFGRLAGALLYSHPSRRAATATLAQNQRSQRNLWSFGISGDLPIVLLRSTQAERMDIVRQMLAAHAYWRFKGFAVDLVILNQDDSVYRKSTHDQIMSLIASSSESHLLDKPGGIFVRRTEQLSHEDHILLQSVARIIISDEDGSLAEQLQRRPRAEFVPPALLPMRRRAPVMLSTKPPRRDLVFFNGLGGFAPDGREYVMNLPPGTATPAPWVNVIGNPHFGTLISESGGSYTWAENCHEYRLTPWHNDPVSDTSGEAFYIRDEQTGRFWSPTPAPAGAESPYVVRHGFGYSVFEVTEDGISSEMWVYVATDAPIKFVRIILRNQSGRTRPLSITGFWEWVLGEVRAKNLMHIVTEMDSRSGALLARNAYNADFGLHTAFVAATEPIHSFTGSRTEFLGRNGTLARPAALGRQRLSGKVGTGVDPCAAMRVDLVLQPGEQREVVFKIGAARNRDEALNLLQGFKSLDACRDAIFMVRAYWNDALGAVHVETPDPSLNILANGWLLYQTLSARMWARTGFYQSGGAFGFRDQLQDAMALVHSRPALLREHLLRAAAHQFVEGDVQHWWHPPGTRGVRTHFSDDYLWLPYATCRYVEALGDTGVLDEKVPFLESRPLRPDEESDYNAPMISTQSATLYEHCVRAIRHGLRFGEHGLPLMGCGDWNDGMNLVGEKSKGESVWLAFFLYDVLRHFAALAHARGDTATAELCEVHGRQLRENIEKNAWDGEWYRRAYFDNGEPLGSASNPECQIDSLPQSWAALTGAGEPERVQMAMNAVDRRLVRRDAGLIQLFDPPFDKSNLEPGYIKGYLPGVRENGGQYTHGAVWTAMAFAAMGDARRAWELFTLINPLRHGDSAASVARYKAEPYVIAADVYSVPPHTGRGGWTWYTGSAGWFYRLIAESFVGLRLEVDKVRFAPCLPGEWNSCAVRYRHCETQYQITLRNLSGNWGGAQTVLLDGVEQTEPFLPLLRDRREHTVEVRFGEVPPVETRALVETHGHSSSTQAAD